MIAAMSETPDPQSWLVEHGDYLYGYAMSRLRNDDLAADLVQETLLAAWKGRHNFKGDSTARTWLTGILKHKITDHIRAEIRSRNLAEAVENDPTSRWFGADGAWQEAPRTWSDNPEQLCRDDEFRAVLQECMERLPEKQRLVFEMREFSGDETETICKALEVSTTNLHVLLHRARLALRGCLEKNWFGGPHK